jgi:hydrogenase maturation protease
VLGVGNILLSDEGAGVHLVQRLQGEYLVPDGVEVLDGGTCGLDLLPAIEGCTRLFIADAVSKEDIAPGEVFRKELADSPGYFRSRISPHQLGLSDVLALAELTGTLPRAIVLFGIKPRILHTGLELSPEVREGVERLLGMVVREISELGFAVRSRI